MLEDARARARGKMIAIKRDDSSRGGLFRRDNSSGRIQRIERTSRASDAAISVGRE